MLEKDKLERIRRVVSHNGGEILSENFMDDDVLLRVKKIERL